jgi:hypothetical protein
VLASCWPCRAAAAVAATDLFLQVLKCKDLVRAMHIDPNLNNKLCCRRCTTSFVLLRLLLLLFFGLQVLKCKELGRAMRIGTNHGSLSARILSFYGDTPKCVQGA